MVVVNKILCGDIKECCYIVWDKTSLDAIIIDPGANYETIYNYIKTNKLNVHAVLLTHGHYDHLGACRKLQQLGYSIIIHKDDAEKCSDNNLNLSKQFCVGMTELFKPNILLNEQKQELKFGSLSVFALHTPGHSEGGCSFIIDNYLFSGDTIFDNGYGRTDFYDGSGIKLRQSISILMPYLRNGYILCAGH